MDNSPPKITLVENEWEVETHWSEELFQSLQVHGRSKAFPPLSSSAKQNNTKEQLSCKSFCILLHVHLQEAQCNAASRSEIILSQEGNSHKITIWKPLETSRTCSNNNSSMQTDGPTTGLGQRIVLIPSNEEQKYPQGLQFMAWVPLMAHSQNNN